VATDAARVELRTAVVGAVATLRRGGIAEPRREAFRILAEIRRELPGVAIAGGVEFLPAEESAALAAAVARRARGEPLAYVTGRAGFRHLELAVTPSTLIPRPETEGLVDLVISRVRAGVAGAFADVGTGSGCIALSLAGELGREVVATDLSGNALAVARANAFAAGTQVSFLRADLTEGLADASCGVLVSNPPYLSLAEYAALDGGVREWEPRLAFVSGADGMAATFRLLGDGLRVVSAGGWIALEVDCSRATEAARRAHDVGWRDVTIEKDLFGRERYLLARRCDR